MTPYATKETRKDSRGNVYQRFTDGSWRRLLCEPCAFNQKKGRWQTKRGERRDRAMMNRAEAFKPNQYREQ